MKHLRVNVESQLTSDKKTFSSSHSFCLTDTKSKKVDRSKGSKSKEIDFDSDSDLPGLDSHETHASDTSTAKTSLKNRRDKKKEKRDGDLFGDDDDLPGKYLIFFNSKINLNWKSCLVGSALERNH